jgi:hypothetical protein
MMTLDWHEREGKTRIVGEREATSSDLREVVAE